MGLLRGAGGRKAEKGRPLCPQGRPRSGMGVGASEARERGPTPELGEELLVPAVELVDTLGRGKHPLCRSDALSC